ncbi:MULTISPECIES: class I SAM-dependent methyltransferase [Bacillaceae]|uniref:Class I SAM-dependent methyltransferase n=1 Tax=Evansella alkalicola TaxID=745819 RepID=A0ABS6JZM4_9BACI|nr:class I SAM-dependent methyltransferase [Litchfieldia alkalitelluris]MBU9723541.1 class I SAM-dependent methyltransferase [Bacillus alkalicola]
MKYRDSGMPEEEVWESFFNPEVTLKLLEVNKDIGDLLDIGTGYGTFLIPAANLISGTAIGIDIDEKYLSICKNVVAQHQIKNVQIINGDISKEVTLHEVAKLTKQVDYISLFNILHCEKPVELMKQAASLLGTGGKVGVIHWIQDETPRGPPSHIRPKPEDIIRWGEEAGLNLKKQVDLPPYHFGLLLEK